MEEGAEAMLLQESRELFPSPQLPPGPGFSSQGSWKGVEMHNSCEGAVQGMETPQLQAAPTSPCGPST